MKICIYVKKENDKEGAKIFGLINHLIDKLNCDIWFFKEFINYFKGDFLPKKKFYLYSNKNEIPKDTSYFISIGGDGTFLESITLLQDLGIPIIGINLGRLGFLTCLKYNEYTKLTSYITSNNFVIEERSLLNIKFESNIEIPNPFALNEFYVHKASFNNLITSTVYVNNEHVNSYWSDGLIVSTPTGSTGYSLSCQGPIIHPNNQCFLITPISQHNLNVRPLIIPDSSEIKIELNARNLNFMISLDARTNIIKRKEVIIISKSNFKIKVALLKGQTFYDNLKQKLFWGQDLRN